jgi:hypothetical protein
MAKPVGIPASFKSTQILVLVCITITKQVKQVRYRPHTANLATIPSRNQYECNLDGANQQFEQVLLHEQVRSKCLIHDIPKKTNDPKRPYEQILSYVDGRNSEVQVTNVHLISRKNRK